MSLQQSALALPYSLSLDDAASIADTALAPLGGPLAVLTISNKILIYTGAGKFVKDFQLEAGVRVCKGGFGWTGDLSLVAVSLTDGAVWIAEYFFAPPRRLKGFETAVNLAVVWQGGMCQLFVVVASH